jgi:DNA polymerase III epsilon subunit-like protein
MEAVWGVVLIGLGVFYFLNKAGNAKVAEQQRQARQEAEIKAKAKKNALKNDYPINEAPAKKSATKTTAKKATSSSSKLRAPDWKPTYDGPMFAQPGEKSQLFSYASFKGLYELDAPYSLIDFETSGFQPGSARILEVAVVKINSQGDVLDEFTTLINPEDGNVGRTDIHQITLGMVKNAPKLSEVVGDLLRILDSSIVVAHNARFEENFLESAFREVGIKHPLMPTIDTLWLSRQVLDLPNYKLATVIDEFGYDFEDAHTALGDVRAMANVLPEMLALGKGIAFPSELLKSPTYVATGKVLPRKSNA